MFLKSITINNYKSIQKATVGFEAGLNIIIGKNGAGKSNLLEFIFDFVSYDAVVGMFAKQVSLDYQFAIYSYDGLDSNELIINLKRERIVLNGEIEVSNEIDISRLVNGLFETQHKTMRFLESGRNTIKDNSLSVFLREIHPLLNLKRRVVSFKLPENPYWLNRSKKYELGEELFPDFEWVYDGFELLVELNNSIILEFSNQGLSVFRDVGTDSVKAVFSKVFDDFDEEFQLVNSLSKFSPIQEIRINPNINVYRLGSKILVENLILEFKVGGSWIPWSYLSDGTKRLFYLITQCLSVNDGLVLIEEPELGIHPHQLHSLMTFLKEQSADKQIILSTHSPVVLDILGPDELNRITVAKLGPSGTQFYKLGNEQIETAQKYMSEVGDLSYYWLHSDLENE